MICFILFCTLTSETYKSSEESLVHKMSISTTVRKLLHFDESSVRTSGVDLLRCIFVIAGSVSHNLTCAEVPIGLWVTSKFESMR